jgi:hypothetical protein
MAGPHLERLRAQKSQKRLVEAPSKPSKLGFEGFEGDQGRPFLENNCHVEAADVAAKNSKNATSAHPQNLQNLHAPSVPTAAYQAVSAEPDGTACRVEIVELPPEGRYRKVFGILQLRPPALVEVERWRQCVQDGSKFLARWGEQAEALGWTSADLFGLHSPPERPHASYNRLSRYDCTGLCWLLEGRELVALTADTASIRNPDTGAITTYRRFNKPALGPLGDSLDHLP